MTTTMNAAGSDLDVARRELVAAGARLAELGLSPGSSGNVSVRVGGTILMSPTGSELGALDPDELSLLDFEGTLIAGRKPSKEYPFHRAFFRRDSATTAIVHVHSVAAMAYSCTTAWSARSAVPPLTPYFVMRVGQTPLIPYADPGDASQADLIEALDFPFRAALLENHGAIASSDSLGGAIEATVELEHTCAMLLSLGSAPVRLVPDDAVARLSARYGSPWTI